MSDIPVYSGAYFSPDGVYRYTLRRDFLTGSGTVAFVLLNPSTADATENDPTVTRCVNYAMSWGYSALYVLNIFALRSTDPKALYAHPDPVGPENDDSFRAVLPLCKEVVCGWGNHGTMHNRNLDVIALIKDAGLQPMALRVTQDGNPQHPLYLRRDLKPIRYNV